MKKMWVREDGRLEIANTYLLLQQMESKQQDSCSLKWIAMGNMLKVNRDRQRLGENQRILTVEQKVIGNALAWSMWQHDRIQG